MVSIIFDNSRQLLTILLRCVSKVFKSLKYRFSNSNFKNITIVWKVNLPENDIYERYEYNQTLVIRIANLTAFTNTFLFVILISVITLACLRKVKSIDSYRKCYCWNFSILSHFSQISCVFQICIF